jgi:hypothetical protein
MIALMDSKVLKLKEFQKVLKSMHESAPEDETLKVKLSSIESVIDTYRITKLYEECFYKKEKYPWQVEAENHLFQ